MKIGQLAERVGVSVEGLRYYERIGLLPRAPRTESGVRLYDDRAVERVRFIKQAQRNGLSLADIKALLAFQQGGQCRQVLALLAERGAAIDAQVEELTSFRQTLDAFAQKCRAAQRRAGNPACPVVDELGGAKR